MATLRRIWGWVLGALAAIGAALLWWSLRRGSAGGVPNLDVGREREEQTQRRAQAEEIARQAQETDARVAEMKQEKQTLDEHAAETDAMIADWHERLKQVREARTWRGY